MLNLKGKLKRLDGGMPRDAFWEWAQANALKNAVSYSPSHVRSLVASVYRVKPEFEAEVAAYVQMLCDATTITHFHTGIVTGLAAFDLRPVRFYNYGQATLALETNKCWMVYPMNLRRLNWQLSRRRD